MLDSDQSLIDRFTAVRAWQRGDERAPHKPLVLVMALAQVQRAGGVGPVLAGDLDPAGHEP